MFRKTRFCRLLFLYLDTTPLGIWKGNKQFPATQVVTFVNRAATSHGPFLGDGLVRASLMEKQQVEAAVYVQGDYVWLPR